MTTKAPKIEVFILKYRVLSLGRPKTNPKKKKKLAWKIHCPSEQSNLHNKHNLKKPHHPPEKKEAPSLHNSTSHWFHNWFHRNSFLKIGCHYFSPGLNPFLRTPYLFATTSIFYDGPSWTKFNIDMIKFSNWNLYRIIFRRKINYILKCSF